MNLVFSLFIWLFLAFLLVQVGYLFFFSLAGTLGRKKGLQAADSLRRIRIFIPGYKEDAVILSSAASALQQDYPAHLVEVVVIADSFSESTLAALQKMPLKVVEVRFEKSTKGKALQKAIDATRHDPVAIALILDADNHMAPGFLHAVNNAFAAGYQAVQGHRTAKNTNTAFAFLDACTEEINNHIFRRGHVAVGLPSALIGSGMAFDWQLFVRMLADIGDTSGEDKEMEFRLTGEGHRIAFLDGAYVFDEKVANTEVFARQRSRWLAMQLEFFEKYFFKGWKELFKGNVAFFNKVLQTFLLPRVMLVAVVGLWTLVALCCFPQLLGLSLALAGALVLSLLLGIPGRWYNRQLLQALLQVPGALLGMFRSVFHIGKARKQFIHTPHGETHSH
ncbi:glycosyltransferase [Paraflavisolibacter sp. H34]|uniref:glycosyltransferase n=1 Tax=Huijunlia imazamoxiresistens TaxID=3127457 RepID=UPI003017492E